VQWPLADASSGSVDAKLGSLGHGPPLGRQTVASIAEGATVLNLRKATAWPNFLSQILISRGGGGGVFEKPEVEISCVRSSSHNDFEGKTMKSELSTMGTKELQ